MTTLPEPPRSPLVDPATGRLTREWVRFFDDLRRAIVSQLDDAVGGRLEALEADALFGGAGDAAGGPSGYNDFAVRSRLDALETELLFPGTPVGTSALGDALEVLEDLMAAVSALAEQGVLEAAFPPPPDPAVARRLAGLEAGLALAFDPGPALRALARRLDGLEAALALTPTPDPALARRLHDLETEGLFG